MTINAKIIADSISPEGVHITTWELEYPRFIHSELMTHRMFSRNAASSRAIPITTVMKQVMEDPAMPEEWGIDQPGMQANSILEGFKKATAIWAWRQAAKAAVLSARGLQKLGLHKQIVNRILEPFVNIKVVVTSTEYNNWYHLRNHKDAQPEIRILAGLMGELIETSSPEVLHEGDWHTPYVSHKCGGKERITYCCGGEPMSLEDALKLSASLCAQVSYRKADESLETAMSIYDKLVTMKPVHASPFEHQATPMRCPRDEGQNWEEGTTHSDRDINLWSGNFKGWIQHRQLIQDNVVEG